MENHRLIITADDYGMSKSVNQAIETGIAFGVLTSTNVMTNMPEYKAAKELRQKYPILSIGIHWCITCGNPVSAPEDIPSLVNEKGEFHTYPEFRSLYRHKKIVKQELLTELQAQYNLFVEVCGEPDYWNTHENSHVDFGVYQLFVDLATKLHIPAMRSHQRLYVAPSTGNSNLPLLWRIIEPMKHQLLNHWQGKAHKKGIASPEGVLVEMYEPDHFECEHLFANIGWKKKHVAEYVVHPAIEHDCPYFGKMVESRLKEYQIVTSQETLDALKKNNIELVGYECAKK